ncbi:MAG: hypothetical protein KGJ90_02530 [Patescibacteria group bacterium]|nr:hypothetical protein [Patescibacteria group bacterium]
MTLQPYTFSGIKRDLIVSVETPDMLLHVELLDKKKKKLEDWHVGVLGFLKGVGINPLAGVKGNRKAKITPFTFKGKESVIVSAVPGFIAPKIRLDIMVGKKQTEAFETGILDLLTGLGLNLSFLKPYIKQFSK